MRTVTKEEILNVLPSLDPDATNGVCKYTKDDGTHCIAGQVLTLLGLPVPTHADGSTGQDGHSIVRVNDASLSQPEFQWWTKQKGYTLDDDAENFLRLMQESGDGDTGRNWGTIIEEVLGE